VLRRLIWPIVIFLLAVAFLSGGVGWWAYGTALDRLSARGQTELSLAADRLQSYLQRFRQLSVVMADHPGLIALLREDSDQFVEAAEQVLLETADKTGSLEVFVVSADGLKVASSSGDAQPDDLHAAAYFRRAMNGALGTAQVYSARTNRRVFYSAAPIQQHGKPPVGAVVVVADIEAVETDWRANPNTLFFTDRYGVIFVANRPEMLLRRAGGPDDQTQVKDITGKYTQGVILPLPGFRQTTQAGHQIWSFPGAGQFPNEALHLTKPSPVIALKAEILIDATPARLAAMLQAAVAAALGLVSGAVLLILTQRRMALSERLRIEEEATRELEGRVARRTEQLSGVNLDLRQQIKERREAENALRQAQQDLIQAGKLSALGQLSAGISHELNQPLMAIRSFADNAGVFLDRQETESARKNIARISDLARRMGRIIKNLRAFSRKEGEPMTDVDLRGVVSAALELSETNFEQAEVKVDWHPPVQPVMVRGGEVRLQQVVVNLLSNAADAMEEQADKRIWLTIEARPSGIRLSVRDNGPGLGDPEKIFDPFYSTKAVGKAEGMGLGLSISYGIVQSFGGRITGRNHSGGGAVFSVDLTPVAQKDAA